MSPHLTPELFEKLLTGELTVAETRDLAWHLIESCPRCAQAVELGWPLEGVHEDLAAEGAVEGAGALAARGGGGRGAASRPASAAEGPKTAVPAAPSPRTAETADAGLEVQEDPFQDLSFERVQARVQEALERLEAERSIALELLEGWGQRSVPEQAEAIREAAEHHSAPLAEELLEHIWALGMEDPKGGEELAGVVLEVLDGIGEGPYGAELVNDLKARTWGYIGNFQRVLTRHREAEASFRKAYHFLQEGTEDLLERARLLDLEASLRRSQRRLEEASELLQQAIAIYLGTDEEHLAGRTLINQARLLREQGKPREAITLLKKALDLVDGDREPRLLSNVQQNLVTALSDLGLYEEAMALLPETRRMSLEHGSRFDLLRLRWLEGVVLLGLGHEARAEAAFLEVRRGFIAQEVGYDTALVSLNLAALYLRQGRFAEVKRFAREMVPIFESRDVHQEALSALALFQKAVEMETVSVRMVEEMSEYLRRARHNPQLRFQAT